METNLTESFFDTTHIPTDTVLIALIAENQSLLEPETERSDDEIRRDYASVFDDFYRYFSHGPIIGELLCMCVECQDLILQSVRALFTYIVSPLCSEHAVHIFPTTVYDNTQDTYQYIIERIIDNIREQENPIYLQSKIVRKLNKLLNVCGVPYLDNVESDHESDYEHSEWEADESDDSLADW